MIMLYLGLKSSILFRVWGGDGFWEGFVEGWRERGCV